MSDLAISVEGVGKKYRIGTPSGTDRLSEVMVGLGRMAARVPTRVMGRLRRRRTELPSGEPAGPGEFWALRDVSFQVKRGETVGIIGRNGAGKSTLLKVLSRITAPTIGRFGVRGRVASLLEVGTGFHGELTGRENIFLSGTLLGMSRQEILKRLDAIVAFAEVDQFLDTPVKRYSSGMQMRLGFAVAAHLESDILIVDEVLAVGDAEFQKKCLGKMGEVARDGRTVLFVSHNVSAIQRLCGMCALFERGRLQVLADTRSVLDRVAASWGEEASWVVSAPDPMLPHFRSLVLCGSDGLPTRQPDAACCIGVTVEFTIPKRTEGLIIAVAVANRDGTYLFSTTSADVGRPCPQGPGSYRTVLNFPPGLFMPRTFRLVAVLYSPVRSYHSVDQLAFTVVGRESLADSLPTGRVGELQILCDWTPFTSFGLPEGKVV